MPLARDLLHPDPQKKEMGFLTENFHSSCELKLLFIWNVEKSDSECFVPREVRAYLPQLRKALRNRGERERCKLKRLVQQPNSFFMDVKCPGCYKITTVFSHAQSVVVCVGCNTVLCQPTGGKAHLTEGCSFRKKQH